MKFKLKFIKDYENSNKKPRKKPYFFKLLTGFVFVIIISYFLYIPQKKSIYDDTLKVGDIIKEDIIIKKDLTVEDKESTEQKRRIAVENVTPIYEYNLENIEKTQSLLNEWFQFIRESRKRYFKNNKDLIKIKVLIEEKFGIELSGKEIVYILKSNIFNKINLAKLFELLKSIEKTGILASKVGAKKSKNGSIQIVSKEMEPYTIKADKLYDLKDVELSLNNFLNENNLSKYKTEIIISIIKAFVDINVSYSLNLTKQEQEKVSSQINPVLIKLKAGKIILRKGDEVKYDDMKIIKLISYEEKIRENKLSNLYLIIAILFFLSLFINKFFKIWDSNGLNKNKLFSVSAATLTISIIIYRICIFIFPIIAKNIPIELNYDISYLYFAIPFGFGALIIAFVFNLQSAVIYSFTNSIISGIICEWNFKIVLYVLLSNLAISYAIGFYSKLKRSSVLKASLFWLLPTNIIFIIILNLTEPNITLIQILINVIIVTFSAILAPLFAYFIIPLWEVIFKLLTDLKLIELTNLNLPIFREMLEKAPGTYHHSQMVASLSETAAQELGLSSLLLTAMALYHDIGKINNPQIFTENHTIYKNPHEELSPRESSKMIIAHISEGLDAATKIKIPKIVKSAISQHHGTKLVKFFYEKARKISSIETDEFDDRFFRYSGEKPQNIENAIIMLADQVEAASKSLGSPTEEELKNVIRTIISSDIEENQFDECDGLTFKTLNIIANSFQKKLSSIYHMRVSYPGFDFKEQKTDDKNSR